MSPLVVVESHDVRVAAPGRLGLLEEPRELLVELRRLAAGEPAAVRAAAPRRLAEYAAESWSSELSTLGVPDAVVVHSFETFRREIWLWVQGDRRWGQLAEHLGARVMRRAVR
jgi:hypothetical protein